MDVSTIRNIWCIGRNYVAHAKELGNPVPKAPLIFLKAGTCLTTAKTIALPGWAGDIHHECELAVQVDRSATPKAFGVALDLTARSLQSTLKLEGAPWTLAKSFTGACPVGALLPWTSIESFNELSFQFFKNDERVQIGTPLEMIFPLETLLKYLRDHFPLADGDLVLTGTPSGVGPIASGDRLRAELAAPSGTLLSSTTWDVI